MKSYWINSWYWKKIKRKIKKEDKHNRELIENRHKIAEELNWKTLDFKLKTGANGKVLVELWKRCD